MASASSSAASALTVASDMVAEVANVAEYLHNILFMGREECMYAHSGRGEECIFVWIMIIRL